jgi:hypothetical protein
MLRPQEARKLLFCLSILVAPVVLGVVLPAQAATLTIGFDEYAFPKLPTIVNGLYAYNLINDRTGAELAANNGDANDFTISFSNSGPGDRSTQDTPNLEFDNQKVISNRGYKDKVSSNNPGTLVSTTTTLRFLPQWNITNLKADFSSLNTSGTLWEYSVIGFLQPDGTPFSAAPSIGAYASGTGFTGSRSLGWYVAADDGTVQNVGMNATAAGAGGNGSSDKLSLTYALAGLAPNTPVGGLIWTTYLEDTRGTGNNSSNFTASWTGFTFSSESANSVPTPALLPGLLALAAGAWRRSKAAQ